MENDVVFKTYDLEINTYVDKKGEKREVVRVAYPRCFNTGLIEELKAKGVEITEQQQTVEEEETEE